MIFWHNKRSSIIFGITIATLIDHVLDATGAVWAWGGNGSGQLGDGTWSDRTTPVAIGGLTNVVAIAAGAQHSVALRSDGTVWTWGANANGQLGIGSRASPPARRADSRATRN